MKTLADFREDKFDGFGNEANYQLILGALLPSHSGAFLSLIE